MKLTQLTFSGTNYFIRRIQDNKKSCPYLPTRQSTVSGRILSQNKLNKVFISHDEKILLKMKKKTDVCECKENWETNYSGLFIRMETDCYTLPTAKFPPSSVNLENNQNIKLDYLSFTQDNYTRSLYESLNQGIEKTLSHSVKNFFALARRNPDLKLFEIDRPLYGLLRGEIISVMNCTERNLKILSTTDFCTEELQVDDGYGDTLFVNAGSNIVKKEFEKKECEQDGLGNIYKVQNRRSHEVFIHQESKVIEFDNVTATLADYVRYFLDEYQFSNLLDFISFGLSGIYDRAFLAARNSYIFSGERYRSAQVGITNAITHNNRNWKQAADQQLDFMDYISPEELMELILGNKYLQWIYFLLQICGYIGGVTFLGSILLASCKKKIACPTITLNSVKTVNNVETRRVSYDVMEWNDNSDPEDTDEEAESVTTEGSEMKARKGSSHMDSPPPYAIVQESQF